MTTPSPRTEFVRRLLASRPLGPDEYAEVLLRLERTLVSRGPFGIAGSIALLNLLSRYPREYEAICLELGADPTVWAEPEEAITRLIEERLRLADERAGTPRAFL